MINSRDFDDKPVNNDQVIAVRGQLPVIVLINLPLVIVICWLYWPFVNHQLAIIWAVCMLLIMAARLIFFIILGNLFSAKTTAAQQQNALIINSAISGLLWGFAGYLFFVEGRFEYQLIILMVLMIKGSGSVFSVVSCLPAFYAFFPASMAPITILFLMQSENESIMMGVISLFFTIFMTILARNLNRTLLESLDMRYENSLLLKETEYQRQQAENANLAKTHFLAAASHDLRQPIHAMSLLLNVLEDNPKHDDVENIVGKIRGTVDSLQNLLNALLDISRLEAGTVSVNLQTVRFQYIREQLEDEFNMLAAEKGLTISWPVEPVFLYTDPVLLEQVLRNLVSNSIRYTDYGSVNINASVTGDKVILEVKDTGIGIDKNQQAAIFDEFYQVGNQQRDRRHGLGLGLAIVSRIMKLLDTGIELSSDIGKGSSFRFALPRAEQQEVDTYVSRTTLHNNTLELKSIVAIIEDDIEAGEAMQVLLESWGSQTFLAPDSDALIAQLSKTNLIPNVIISDFQLDEGKNGVNEIAKLRGYIKKDIPALLISGNIAAEHQLDVKNSGLPILYKPAAPARLRAFLRTRKNT